MGLLEVAGVVCGFCPHCECACRCGIFLHLWIPLEWILNLFLLSQPLRIELTNLCIDVPWL